MSKEKQIEEISKVIDKSPWKLYQDFTGCHINSSEIAEYLYNADYRKQSEVVKEIFREIENYMIDSTFCGMPVKSMLSSKFAELKKKYSEEPVND